MSDGAILGIGIGVVVFLLIGGFLLFSAWGSVPVDKVGLHYNGGPIEGQSFARIIQPGSGAQFLGPRDTLITLPIDQRSYVTCAADNPCSASSRAAAGMTASAVCPAGCAVGCAAAGPLPPVR